MKALITGMGGFAGGHLAEYLLAEGWQVAGTVLPGEAPALPEVVASSCGVLTCDITKPGAVEELLSGAEPQVVFHLAAQSSVAASWKEVEATFEVNVMGTLALLEAVRRTLPSVRVVLISSAEVYGESFNEGVVSEDTPLRPVTPYASSKACSDWVAGQFAHHFGLDIRRIRPFSHTGPRQKPLFAAPSFARQIAAIEAGLQEPVIRVGNLDARRDFTDVRDMVRAYGLVVTQGEPGSVYNACSGRTMGLGDVLEGLLGRTSAPIDVKTDPSLLRAADLPVMAGDATRLNEATGWKPAISWEQTLDDLLSYWRHTVTHELNH